MRVEALSQLSQSAGGPPRAESGELDFTIVQKTMDESTINAVMGEDEQS
jgi:hypothetical protein